jgi:hypothetical protein
MSSISPVSVNDVSLCLFEKQHLSVYFFGFQIIICIEILDKLSRGELEASVSCAVSPPIGARLNSDTWQELAKNLQTSVGRTVIYYDDFDVGISLVKAGLNGASHPLFTIIARNNGRNAGLVSNIPQVTRAPFGSEPLVWG